MLQTKLQINRRRLHRNSTNFIQLIHSEVGKRNLFFLKLAGPMISVLGDSNFHFGKSRKMLIITEVIVLCIFSIVCVTQAKKIMKSRYSQVQFLK